MEASWPSGGFAGCDMLPPRADSGTRLERKGMHDQGTCRGCCQHRRCRLGSARRRHARAGTSDRRDRGASGGRDRGTAGEYLRQRVPRPGCGAGVSDGCGDRLRRGLRVRPPARHVRHPIQSLHRPELRPPVVRGADELPDRHATHRRGRPDIRRDRRANAGRRDDHGQGARRTDRGAAPAARDPGRSADARSCPVSRQSGNGRIRRPRHRRNLHPHRPGTRKTPATPPW